MRYILELINKEIRISNEKLSGIIKEGEPGFDSLWSKGFNDGSIMYLHQHIKYLIMIQQNLIFKLNDNDDDNI